MLLKACVNGMRRPAEHPALPATAAQLASDVAAVMAAGAGAVHLHVKDEQGVDTLDGAALASVLTAVSQRSPGLPVGVTTGAWAVPHPGERVAAIRGWFVLPAFASVNWHEDGADDVAGALLERGVGVEAGLWHADSVDAWLASVHRERCCRVLIELPDGLDAAATEVAASRLLDRVRSGVDDRIPVLLHGEGSSTWPALRRAGPGAWRPASVWRTYSRCPTGRRHPTTPLSSTPPAPSWEWSRQGPRVRSDTPSGRARRRRPAPWWARPGRPGPLPSYSRRSH